LERLSWTGGRPSNLAGCAPQHEGQAEAARARQFRVGQAEQGLRVEFAELVTHAADGKGGAGLIAQDQRLAAIDGGGGNGEAEGPELDRGAVPVCEIDAACLPEPLSNPVPEAEQAEALPRQQTQPCRTDQFRVPVALVAAGRRQFPVALRYGGNRSGQVGVHGFLLKMASGILVPVGSAVKKASRAAQRQRLKAGRGCRKICARRAILSGMLRKMPGTGKTNSMSPAKAEVSSSYVLQIFLGLRQAGCDLSDVLSDYGLRDEDLRDVERRIPIEVEHALLRAGVERTGDTLLGLHAGERIGPGFMGIIGYTAMSAETLSEAIDIVLNHEMFRTEIAQCSIEYFKDSYAIRWTPLLPPTPLDRHRIELTFASWKRFVDGTIGMPIEAIVNREAVHFRHAPGGDLSAYKAVFGDVRIRFGAEDDAIFGPLSALDLPLMSADPTIHRAASQKLASIVSRQSAQRGFMETVRHQITEALAEGSVSLESVADRLKLPHWRLQRMLKAQGYAFSDLVDAQRKRLAEKYLSDSRYTIGEVALSLGYSEQSAFTRAFRRWYGSTPGEFRAAQSAPRHMEK